MSIASQVLEALNQVSEAEKVVEKWKSFNIVSWDSPLRYAAVNTEKDRKFVSSNGTLIPSSGLIHKSDFGGLTYNTIDQAKAAIDLVIA